MQKIVYSIDVFYPLLRYFWGTLSIDSSTHPAKEDTCSRVGAGWILSVYSFWKKPNKQVYFQKSKIEEENMPPVCYTLFYENSQFL